MRDEVYIGKSSLCQKTEVMSDNQGYVGKPRLCWETRLIIGNEGYCAKLPLLKKHRVVRAQGGFNSLCQKLQYYYYNRSITWW